MAYNFKRIESKWSKKWLNSKVYEPNLNTAKKPFYNLMMFPYPSAEGLHVGNMYAFTGSDIYGRFQRMNGNDVFEPIGLDGFGIHSENYAIKIGAHPVTQAKKSEKNFYKQLQSIGNGFAWNERLETYDPEYYKWTQWIFVQMFKAGLAYRKKSEVNWCPSCKTVLADEQVIAGKCERCNSEVGKKELEQWFFRITKYAERLLNNLNKLDWSEKVKVAQKSWIGKSEGAEIEFRISNSEFRIKVFTTRPDTLFGATYLVLAPEHPIIQNSKLEIRNYADVETYILKAKQMAEIDRIAENKEKTGVELKGVRAINPATNAEIPIFIADYVLGGYGTGAIMAVPAHDERDFEFAKKFNLPIKMVVCPHYPAPTCPILDHAYVGEGHLVVSGKFNGLKSSEAGKKIAESVGGKMTTTYRLRDWLVSRQRYWGPPIPMIFCKNCKKSLENSKFEIRNSKLNQGEIKNPGWFSVPEKDLPVILPMVKDFRPKGTGESPLAESKSFYEIKCPKCKGNARRETDVSDTFLDSAWYFFRYIDTQNKKEAFSEKRLKRWLPVNMYIGGAEHSVLHLLYTRFVTMFFKDIGLINFEEPFPKFRTNGLLISGGVKMSKSKGNVANPDEYVRKFGADTLRTYLMFLGPFQQGGDWRDEGIMGVVRFLNRVWIMGEKISKSKPKRGEISDWMNPVIKKITDDIQGLAYNTCISELMIALNKLEAAELNRKDFEAMLLLLAPFAPFIAEELWEKLGHNPSTRAKHGAGREKSIHIEKWPEFDAKKLVGESFELIVQVNGKMRGKITAPTGTTEAEARKLALEDSNVSAHLAGQTIKKAIFVPGRLINFVV